MEPKALVRCRVAACREAMDDGNVWSYYLINDSDAPLDSAELCEFDFAWGDFGNTKAADMRITGLAPGAAALIWRDDGSAAELRMDLSLLVRMGDREVRLEFEFPRLYRMKDLPLVRGLGKPGFEVAAEA